MEAGIIGFLLRNWRVILPALLILGMLGTIRWQASRIETLDQDKATLTARVSEYAADVDRLQLQAQLNAAASIAAARATQQLQTEKSKEEELIHAEKNVPGDCAVVPAVIRHNIERLYARAPGSAPAAAPKAAARPHLWAAPAAAARGH